MNFDLIGALCSFTSTILFIRLNPFAWPVGLVATLINGMLYWNSGIYADMALEVVYAASMLYGWILWRYSKRDISAPRIPTKFAIVLTLLLFCAIYYTLTAYTHSTIPLMDAITTSLSLLAQWLMCHKIIWTWVLWFITDGIYAVMYSYKNLPYHTILMVTYCGMAVYGYVFWLKKKGALKAPLLHTTQNVQA